MVTVLTGNELPSGKLNDMARPSVKPLASMKDGNNNRSADMSAAMRPFIPPPKILETPSRSKTEPSREISMNNRIHETVDIADWYLANKSLCGMQAKKVT